MRGLPREVQVLAVKQGGVVRRHQLLARGMDSSAIDRARRIGLLHDVHVGYGVYAIAPLPLLGDDAWIIAAMLAAGSRGAASHATAAKRWQIIDHTPATIHLATPLELVGPRGVVIHRTVLRPGDVVRHGRFRMTTVERTLLDLATSYHPQPLVRALAEAEFHHRTMPADVLAVLRRGHPGSARLREALEIHVPGYGTAKSRLERAFRELLIARGIPLPERNRKIGGWTVDCVWFDRRVVIELDGGQHQRPGQAAVDADRDMWLRRNRWVVRRYTWKQVRRTPDIVIADLFDAFEEARVRGFTDVTLAPIA